MMFKYAVLVILGGAAIFFGSVITNLEEPITNTWDFSNGNSVELADWPSNLDEEEYSPNLTGHSKVLLPDGVTLEGEFLRLTFYREGGHVKKILVSVMKGNKTATILQAKEIYKDLKLSTSRSQDRFLENMQQWELLVQKIPFLACRRINFPLVDLSIDPIVGTKDWQLNVSINVSRLPVTDEVVKFSQLLLTNEIGSDLLQKIDPQSRTVSGNTLLHESIANARNKTALELIESGAKIDSKGLVGQTPLYTAVLNGNFEIANELLLRNADINAKTANGTSMLHVVAKSQCKCDDLATAKWLFANGVDIDSVDRDGNTALHHANRRGNDQVARFLLKQGADSTLKNWRGNLASDEKPIKLFRPNDAPKADRSRPRTNPQPGTG